MMVAVVPVDLALPLKLVILMDNALTPPVVMVIVRPVPVKIVLPAQLIVVVLPAKPVPVMVSAVL